MSHVFHRAVLESIDLCEAHDAIAKVIEMASAFNRSIPRASHFSKWQESKGIRPLLPITVCRTRWHGYLNSMVRHLIIQSRIEEWIMHVGTLPKNDSIDVEALQGLICSEREITQLKGIAYILTHLTFYDSVA
jgi:hypothetical protein